MLKLLMFVPCDKVIVGEQGVVSLISVLENVNLSGKVSGELPRNAALPKEWMVSVLFARSEEVINPVPHLVKVELFAPDGELEMTAETAFDVSDKFQNFRSNFSFPVFPIGQSGQHVLKLSYKEKNQKEWQYIADYPISVVHILEEVKDVEIVNKKILQGV